MWRISYSVTPLWIYRADLKNVQLSTESSWMVVINKAMSVI